MNVSDLDRQEQTLQAIPSSARAARQFVSDALRLHGAAPKVIGDFALVVSELASNIIEHGDGTNLVIYLDTTDPDWWEVEVVGGSSAPPRHLLEPETWIVAGADAVSGRGLGIVRHLMDHIISESDSGQISIRCRCQRDESTGQ